MHEPIDAPDRSAAARAELAELCLRHYPAVQDQVHRLLAQDIRRGRPWLSAMLSTGDLVHEIFLGVVRDFDGFRGETDSQFVAYLARLTRNRLIDTLRYHQANRRDSRRDIPVHDRMVGDQATPPELSMQREEVELVQRAMAALPERNRALLRARIEDGDSFAQLAEAFAFPSADAARKAFHKVQARLLARMQVAKESGE